jgi:hypothetical protein
MRSGWVFLYLLIVHGAAQAQIFSCKDASGRMITSDRPMPECANRPMRELNKSGIVVREIQAPLTPEQKRELQLLAERRKAEEAALEEQRKSDLLLRSRYHSESDIDHARKRALGMLEEQAKNDAAMLAVAQKNLKSVNAELDVYRKKNAVLPPVAQRKLEEANEAVVKAQKTKGEREAEMQLTNVKFDETLKRYRELVNAPPVPGQAATGGKSAAASN